MLEHFRGSGIIVRFIEYMDVGNRNHWQMERVVPSHELLARIHARWPLHALPGNYHGEVAERYALTTAPEKSASSRRSRRRFAARARARVCPRKVLYTCLFATQGLDLKPRCVVAPATTSCARYDSQYLENRTDHYSEQRAQLSSNEHPLRKIEMYYIGG